MAADILNVTINFDANISKVVNDDDEWTTSGQTYGISTWGLLPFVVTLSDGYVLDTVVVNSTRAALNTKTDTQFTLSDISAANYEAEITLTSKAATTTVTLSAGIYIFKEVPATPSFTSGYEVPLTFTYTDSEETLSCTKIFFATDEDSGDLAMNYYTYISDGNEYVSEQVYIFESDFWNHDWFKIITVTADQSVPEDFYNWFTANTTAQSSKLSVDLTTLSGWSNLSAGSHVIKLVAKGTGYRDSEKSAGVVVSKAPSTVTLEKGTYKWKDSPTFTSSFNETVSYTSNGVDWDKFRVNGFQNIITYGIPNTNVYVNRTWVNEAYKTITLATAQTVSAEFYKWAITDGNLVKQAAGETWLLNEGVTPTTMSVIIPFVSNGNTFSSIDMIGDKPSRYAIQYDITLVFEGLGGWSNTAYRTIVLSEPASGGFLKWLTANAVKQ